MLGEGSQMPPGFAPIVRWIRWQSWIGLALHSLLLLAVVGAAAMNAPSTTAFEWIGCAVVALWSLTELRDVTAEIRATAVRSDADLLRDLRDQAMLAVGRAALFLSLALIATAITVVVWLFIRTDFFAFVACLSVAAALYQGAVVIPFQRRVHRRLASWR